MKNSFESNLIKIPAKDVVDELYGQPPTKGERDIAEFRKKKIENPKKAESQEFRDLIIKEAKALKNFFGMDMKVPGLPEEITEERYEKWKKMKFELHYLPKVEMSENMQFPGWEKKPKELFRLIKEGGVNASAIQLNGQWVLIDERVKPKENQMYENDPFKEVIKQLREEGIVKNYEIMNSRFNISNDELQKEEVRKALAEVLEVISVDIGLPRVIEWNFLGNAFYKEWGDNETGEWFEDKHKSGNSFFGGISNHGGLSRVVCQHHDMRANFLGFRPMVRFPKK